MRIIGWQRDAAWRIQRVTAPDGSFWFNTKVCTRAKRPLNAHFEAQLAAKGCVLDEVHPPVIEGRFLFVARDAVAELGPPQTRLDCIDRSMKVSSETKLAIVTGLASGEIPSENRQFEVRLTFSKRGSTIVTDLHRGPVPNPVAGYLVGGEDLEGVPDLTDFVLAMPRRL